MSNSDIPLNIQSIMKNKAASEWPGDYGMQKHVIQEQIEAWRYMDSTTQGLRNEMSSVGDGEDFSLLETVLSKCTREWPDDFSMQRHTFEQEMNAVEELGALLNSPPVPDDIFSTLFAKAVAEWPGDIGMQVYELKSQIDAFSDLGGLFSNDNSSGVEDIPLFDLGDDDLDFTDDIFNSLEDD